MSPPRILIVEDESVVTLDLRHQLQTLGYEVAGETRFAEEAVSLAETVRPSLVLMDIHLAGAMDGIEAAKLLRSRCQLPVIFLTAFAGDAVVDRAKDAQPYGYVVKPFDEPELRTVIEIALHRHAAELRQRAADEELAAVIQTSLDGYCVLTPEGRILELNEAGCRMLDYPREELVGRTIDELMATASPAEAAATRDRIQQTGAARLERKYRSRRGQVIDLEISATFRPTDGGRIIAFFRDITERKRADAILGARLRLSEFAATHALEELLTKTVDEAETVSGSSIGFFHFVDADQNTIRLQTWSTHTLAHMCTAEGKGQHYPIAKAGVWADSLRLARPVVHNDYATLAHRRSLPEGHAPVIRELVVPILREDRVVAILGVGNKPTNYLEQDVEAVSQLANLSWDIIARKRADFALQESHAHLRRAQDVARLGSYTFDVATGTWTASAQLDALFGIDDSYPHTIAGWVEIVDPDQRQEMQDYFARHVLGGRNRFDKEYRIVRRSDGQTRWVSGLGELEFDAAGRPVRMVGTIQDVTERRHLEEQLRQAQKMEVVGQLAGGVAHDFNNILTAITLNLELMRLTPLPTEARTSIVELEGLSRRAARLTQQLLMFARRKAMQLATLDVNATLAGLVKMLRRLLGEHITLTHVPSPSPLWVEADAAMLDQAVMNLCINARDAMPGGGQLTLAAERIVLDEAKAAALPDARPGEFVRISVSDTGTGIPPEVLAHLFEPFYTTKEIGRGTGLGLASVHGVVHQQQGWINVETVVNRGTTFRIFLPWSSRATARSAPPPAETTLPRGRETVLLVEDEIIVRQVSVIALRGLGYQVYAAADGAEALRVWEEHRGKFDLLLSDMVMPGGMTGLQLAQALRERKPDLKVLLVSGYSTEIVQAETLLAQGIHFLPKPFESRQLAQTVRRCLEQPVP